MHSIKMDGVPSNIQLHQKVEAHARVSISFFEMPLWDLMLCECSSNYTRNFVIGFYNRIRNNFEALPRFEGVPWAPKSRKCEVFPSP